jgi:Right handed beta helix region
MHLNTRNCCILAAAAFAFTVHSAGAHTLRVGTCVVRQQTFTTIQSAVDAAADGDAIAICPGTYPEQVSITKSIALRGVRGMDAPQIVVPAGGLVQNTTMTDTTATAAQILVAPATPGGANVSGLVVDAADNNNTDCNLEMIGIYYKNAGGTIRRNTVKNQIGPAGHQNCQNGVGILVENQTVGTDAVAIESNNVSNFDKNGIVMRQPGSIGTISRNTVTGIGPTTILAQNGIELAYGATANVVLNTVSDLLYTPETFGSSAIIVYDVPSTLYQAPPTIQKNILSNAQFGVAVDGANGTPGNLIQVSANTISNVEWAGVGIYSETAVTPAVNGDFVNVVNNKVTATTIYDGIDVCGDNNTISKNTVADSSTESAIHLDALCEQANGDPSGTSNTVSNNRVTTACVGILSGPPRGQNNIGPNNIADATHRTLFGSDDYTCGPLHAPRKHDAARGRPTSRVAVSP